jgi:hypothetical protein
MSYLPREMPRSRDYVEAMAYERLDTLRRAAAEARLAAESRNARRAVRPPGRWAAIATLWRDVTAARRSVAKQAG